MTPEHPDQPTGALPFAIRAHRRGPSSSDDRSGQSQPSRMWAAARRFLLLPGDVQAPDYAKLGTKRRGGSGPKLCPGWANLRSRRLLTTFLAIVICVVVFHTLGWTIRSSFPDGAARSYGKTARSPIEHLPPFRRHPVKGGLLQVDMESTIHPVYQLVQDARERWKTKLAKQSRTLKQAVAEYERRYGLIPPKGFDKWWHYVVWAAFLSLRSDSLTFQF